MCPETSGYVSNVLILLNDESGLVYPSGKVGAKMFALLPQFNGLMGTDYSGSWPAGCITPDISGSIYEGVLEAFAAKELAKGSMATASRSYTLTSFKEGDSTVTMSDASKNAVEFYKILSADFDKLLQQAKYSLVSNAPSSVIGLDAIESESSEGATFGKGD
jgi:hypothetical protein